MSRLGVRLAGLVGLVALAAAVLPGTALAGNKKLVEGTVYDTTCAGVTCGIECPPPPHCGPVTARAEKRIVCPMGARMIACPLARAGVIVCVQAEGCPGRVGPPVWTGEGGVVTVRRRGSAKVLAKLPVAEGHFSTRLAPGEYVLRAYPPEPQCWSGEKTMLAVSARAKGPLPAAVDVSDSCVAHPGAK